MTIRLKIFTTFIACSWTVLIILVFLSSIQESPIGISRVTKNFQIAFIPQGWAFFTKNCREPLMTIFSIDHLNGPHELSTIANRSNPLTSFDRVDRVQMVEVSALLRHIGDDQWSTCPEAIQNCISLDSAKKIKSITLENTVANPSLCGEILITMSDTVPWAWAKLIDRKQMPGKSIHLFITCKKRITRV